MQVDDFLRLAQVAMETAVFISAPVLVLGLTAGLAVSIFQAATQINDAALAFIPKIAAAVLAMMLFGPFVINRLAWFATWSLSQIATLKGG
jgi:flagellar biosynthetic protein FliQ